MYPILELAALGGIGLLALSFGLFRLGRVPEVVTAKGHAAVVFAHELAGALGTKEADVPHLAIALLSDADVARELELRGVSLRALCDDLEALSPAPLDEEKASLGNTPALAQRIAAASGGKRSAGPTEMFEVLLEDDDSVGEVLKRHGVTRASWRAERRSSSDDAPGAPGGGPYRGDAEPAADTEVLLWNDEVTTIGFVREILRGTFQLGKANAFRIAAMVHARGVAIVDRYDHKRAESLVRDATRAAQAAGVPLTVTMAPAGHLHGLSRFALWRLRRERTNVRPAAKTR